MAKVRMVAGVVMGAALLAGCQSEQRIVRYNPFLANVPGAQTQMEAVGERFENFQDPGKVEGDKTLIENPDGTVTLIAKNVQHLMRNMQLCIEHQDDAVMLEQVISNQTKQQFQAEGRDPQEAVEYIKENWGEISKLFSRMPFGEHSANVILQQPAKRTRVLELTGLATKGMQFTELWAVMEKGNWKFLWVK